MREPLLSQDPALTSKPPTLLQQSKGSSSQKRHLRWIPPLVSTPQQYPHPQQQQSQPLEPYQQQQQQQQQRQRQVFLDLLGRITELEKRVEESDNRLTSAIKREMRSSQIPSKGTFQSRGDLWDTIPRHREVEEIEEDMAERQPTAFWTETTTAAATGYPRSSRMRAFGVQVCRLFLHKSLLHQRIEIVGRFFNKVPNFPPGPLQ